MNIRRVGKWEQRTTMINGTLYRFTRDYDAHYNFVFIAAHRWTGYRWELVHKFEV